jgi:hypothetical protein
MFRTLALLLLLAAAAPAQFVYGLNVHGKLTLNGTVLDSLPTSFDPDVPTTSLERWWDLGVHGPDRFAMRLDGRVQKNGTKLFQLEPLKTTAATFVWVQMVVDDAGGVHMLRQDGERALDGVPVITYPLGSSFFVRLAVDDVGTAFSMRADGAIFKATSTTMAGKFTAAGQSEPADGTAPTTIWVDVAVDLQNLQLLALRADGRLFKIPLEDLGQAGDPPVATQEALLPFPPSPNQSDLYTRLVVAQGEWRVLRADGAVFTPASLLEPIVDYEGEAVDETDIFTALTWDGTDMRAIRGDGRVFQNLLESDSLFNLIGADYRGLATGSEPPDLTKFKNPKPKASTYKLQVLEGDTAVLPVLVSDIEKLPVDLIVTTNPDKPLPAGATLVDDGLGNRHIAWDGTQPVGVYKCPLMVDDGVNKPVKFIETIKVVAADSNPDNKNKAPKGFKPKTVQALVDHEVRIPVFGIDLDDQPLTFSVNEEKEPFKTKGASFDTNTNEFVWTPTFDDIGTIHPKILVSDGTKTVSFTLTVKVVNSLIFETEDPEP